MTYTIADLYLDDMKDLLDANWVEYEEVPLPQLLVVNLPTDMAVRVDLNVGDAIIIRSDAPEQIRYRGNIAYYDRVVSLSLDMMTKENRQRLHDMWRTVRVICFGKKHDFPNYQLIKIVGYQELVQEESNIWRGIVRIQLENHAILAEQS